VVILYSVVYGHSVLHGVWEIHYATNWKMVSWIPGWGHWICQSTQSFQQHSVSGVDWPCNRNEYQESSWGVRKSGRRVKLTTSSPFLTKCGCLDMTQLYGSPLPVTGIALPFCYRNEKVSAFHSRHTSISDILIIVTNSNVFPLNFPSSSLTTQNMIYSLFVRFDEVYTNIISLFAL
jgi:hypothetical protein